MSICIPLEIKQYETCELEEPGNAARDDREKKHIRVLVIWDLREVIGISHQVKQHVNHIEQKYQEGQFVYVSALIRGKLGSKQFVGEADSENHAETAPQTVHQLDLLQSKIFSINLVEEEGIEAPELGGIVVVRLSNHYVNIYKFNFMH